MISCSSIVLGAPGKKTRVANPTPSEIASFWIQSEQDKSLCESAIKKAFHDSKKVFITWFENGNWVGSLDDLINFLTSHPIPQQTSAATDCPPRGKTGKQRPPYPWDYKIHLVSGKPCLY